MNRRAPLLAVALDVADPSRARDLAALLRGHVDIVKVGLELFTAAGPELVLSLVDGGLDVFLDLKVHDIPATAAGAVRSAAGLGVELLTLHASGGHSMLEAAATARSEAGRPRLLAVTMLTSLGDSDLEEIGVSGSPEEAVLRLARLARAAGCDGVVTSPREAAQVREACGDDFLIVTPGIRPEGSACEDQVRAATPAAAIAAGADVLVVGRPILRAPDPGQAADEIRDQMRSARNDG